MSRTVLISGAGPAGMALAQLLGVRGWAVTVVERAAEIRSDGYAVDLRGEGVDVADELGVLGELTELRTVMNDVALLDRDGNDAGTLPVEEVAGDLEVAKADLTRVLYDRSRDHAEYLFGDSIAALAQTSTGVEATLDDGGTRTVDLVVGADGVWSRTRRLAVSDDAAVVRHLGLSGAGFTAPNFLGLRSSGVLRAHDNTAVYAYSTNEPHEMTVSMTFASGSPSLDREPRQDQEASVRAAFAGQGWQIPALLDAMADAPDFYFASALQVVLPTWSSGRVTLLGDAACCAAPTSGMGTTQAFIAARTLVRALDAHAADDIPKALREYEQQVRPLATANQQRGADEAARFGAGPS